MTEIETTSRVPVARTKHSLYYSLTAAFASARKAKVTTIELLGDCTLGSVKISDRQIVLTGSGTVRCTSRSTAFEILQGGSLIISPTKNRSGIRFVLNCPDSPNGKFAQIYGQTPSRLEIHEGVTIDVNGKDNSEGGNVIYVHGKGSEFVMAGGVIRNLYSKRNEHSGAVRIGRGARFLMNGGLIEHCHSLTGTRAGAVYVEGGNFRMMRGRIESCGINENGMTASPVYVEDGSFEMLGGRISGTDNGMDIGAGTVHLTGDTRMLLWGDAEICDNDTAGAIRAFGRDVRVSIRSGKIRNNRAIVPGGDLGGGICFESPNGVLEIIQGKIIENIAGQHGGGVYFNGKHLSFNEDSIYNNTLNPGSIWQRGSDLFIERGLIKNIPTPLNKPFHDSGCAIGAWYVENRDPSYDPDTVRSLEVVNQFQPNTGYIAGPTIIPESVEKNEANGDNVESFS